MRQEQEVRSEKTEARPPSLNVQIAYLEIAIAKMESDPDAPKEVLLYDKAILNSLLVLRKRVSESVEAKRQRGYHTDGANVNHYWKTGEAECEKCNSTGIVDTIKFPFTDVQIEVPCLACINERVANGRTKNSPLKTQKSCD